MGALAPGGCPDDRLLLQDRLRALHVHVPRRDVGQRRHIQPAVHDHVVPAAVRLYGLLGGLPDQGDPEQRQSDPADDDALQRAPVQRRDPDVEDGALHGSLLLPLQGALLRQRDSLLLRRRAPPVAGCRYRADANHVVHVRHQSDAVRGEESDSRAHPAAPERFLVHPEPATPRCRPQQQRPRRIAIQEGVPLPDCPRPRRHHQLPNRVGEAQVRHRVDTAFNEQYRRLAEVQTESKARIEVQISAVQSDGRPDRGLGHWPMRFCGLYRHFDVDRLM